MIGDTIVSDSEREIGTVQVFTTESGLQGWARDYYLGEDWLALRNFPSGYFGYIVRPAPVTQGDLARWGLMEWARESGKFFEDFAKLITSENPQLTITCGGETREDLYDGVLEVLDSINEVHTEGDTFDCGFKTPEEALEEGIKRLKAISHQQWYNLIYGRIHADCEENGIAYLDIFKMLEFEAWSETIARSFFPPSEYPINF